MYTGIIGGIAAVLMAVWFYRTAEKVGTEPFVWMAAGPLAYYFASYFWSIGVIRPILKGLSAAHSPNLPVWGGLLVSSQILIGVLFCYLVQKFVIRRMGASR